MGLFSAIGRVVKAVAPKIIKGLKGAKNIGGKVIKGITRGASKIAKGLKRGIMNALGKLNINITGQTRGATGVEKVVKSVSKAPVKLSKQLQKKGKFKMGGKPNVGGKKAKRKLSSAEMEMFEI
jgi:hypothetical protein